MKIGVVYICPTEGGRHFDLACRFVASYAEHEPGYEHRLIVVSNGGQPTEEMRALFGVISNAEFFVHDDSGYDIGGYQAAARAYGQAFELMVFFGGSTYIRGPAWLSRMAQAFERHGRQGLFGAMGNQGVPHLGVYPHLRTTGFWLAPALFNQHPLRVTRPELRYPFEHGRQCLTQWVRDRGLRAYMVTWGGEFEFPHWDAIQNGFHRGDQSALLVGDRLTEPPFYPTP